MTAKKPDPILQAVERIFFAQIVMIAGTSGLFYYAARDNKLGFFAFVFIAGSFGASVALLRRVQRSSKTVASKLLWSWRTTLMPFLYGGIMAGLVYFLFASDILTGSTGNGLVAINLFPDFSLLPGAGELTRAANEATPKPDGSNQTLAPFQVSDWLKLFPKERSDAGKLIVWAFLAGYSENFVTRIMSHLEGTSSPGQTESE